LGTKFAQSLSLSGVEILVAVRRHKPVKQLGTQLANISRWRTAIGLTACLVLGAIASVLINTITQAQPAQSQTIFENVTVRPNFSPNPMIIRGISGGAVPADQIAGRKDTPTGPCVGFVDEPPDHIINLTAFFNSLSLLVESSQDTTLVVSGPGGTWCNDDFQGKNPGIAGEWQAGTYKVWVGSYKQSSYYPYVIKMSETSSK
jgi:hypothetical protein